MFKKVALLLLITTSFACSGTEKDIDGGPCAYKDYPGTCTGQADGKFTYKGSVEGKEVEYMDNGPGPATLTEGQSQSCTLKYITKGTCTPCSFDIGPCSSAAFGGAPL